MSEHADRGLRVMRGDAGLPAVPRAAESERHRQLREALDALRAEHRAWDVAVERWHLRYTGQLQPLLQRRLQLDAALVELLDHADLTMRLSLGEREVLSELVCVLASGLVDAGRMAFAGVLERHRAPAAVGEDDAVAVDAPTAGEDDATMRRVIAEAFGLDEADVAALEDPAALYAQALARAQPRGPRARRPRGAPVDAQVAPPPLRVLFRRLAARVHPDRADDAEDAHRRTGLMQQLNAANAAGDLAALLELQAQLDLAPAAADEDPARLLQALEQQCEQLRAQVRARAERLRSEYGLAADAELRADTLDKLMAGLKRAVAAEIAWLEQDLRTLGDPRELKQWLKWQRQAD